MINLKTAVLLLISSVLFSSCYNFGSDKEEKLSFEKDFQLVNVKSGYDLKIPKYLSKTTELNDEASLQYQNIMRETYIIVLDESKDLMVKAAKSIGEYDENLSLLENYKNLQIKYSLTGINITDQYNEKSLKINGINALTVDIDAYVQDINFDITYFLTFYEGPDKVYMMMAWTLKNRKKKYKSTFDLVAGSFKLNEKY